jgi:hypothetical protein
MAENQKRNASVEPKRIPKRLDKDANFLSYFHAGV